MRLSEGQGLATSPYDQRKMEERKRSLIIDHDDVTQPSKRQATTVNGAPIKMEPEKEKDIENFQKEAIWRQMREYKRERTQYEAQVNDLTKRAAHHDDHLRLIDSWFDQLLDEIVLQVNEQAPMAEARTDSFRSSLLAESGSVFEAHLKTRSEKIRGAISDIFTRTPQPLPEVKELQERLAALLAQERAHVAELQRITSDRDQLTERLENASYRYLVAEKKLDRAKSSAVQKLEQAAIMKSQDDSATAAAAKSAARGAGHVETNGEVDATANAAAESARKEAVAIAEKRKLQVDQLEMENRRLTEEVSAAQMKQSTYSDDDYAKTGLFTHLKNQHDEAIKRLNDLEATNIQLREEAQKLHSERTAYRTRMDEESRSTTNETESQLARSETDLARIRSIRDELTADIAVRKSAQETTRQSLDSAKELDDAREGRISTLESEIQRLRLQLGESSLPESEGALDELAAEELRTKLRTSETNYRLLEGELSSMMAAWTKTKALAAKKVADIASWEEQLQRLNAEKTKADQKYFAAMKAKETREAELRALKAQNAKTSEIVSQLKDAESSTRALVANLEKQIAESKDSLASLTQSNRSLQQKVGEATIVSENLRGEITELKKVISQRDTAASNAASAQRSAEVELEECKVRLEETKKALDALKKRSAGNKDSTEADDWRRIAICPVCNSNLRNTTLKLCGHVFCDVCVQNLITNRSRKCPSCGKAFGVNDSMPIVLA